jgi:hypothetical protein
VGVRTALPVAAASAPARLSLAALVLSAVGVAAATWMIVASDGDPTHVRWPLVVAPIAVCLVPVLAPRPGARIGAALALGAWCFLAMFSIGFTQLPALAAAFAAMIREEP